MDWTLFGRIADWCGLIGLVIALGTLFNTLIIICRNRSEKKRLDHDITIKLVSEDDTRSYLIPKLKRREFSRPEILGRIGMIPMIETLKNKRFSIDYLNTDEFIENLYKVQNSKTIKEFNVICTNDELSQFELK